MLCTVFVCSVYSVERLLYGSDSYVCAVCNFNTAAETVLDANIGSPFVLKKSFINLNLRPFFSLVVTFVACIFN